MNKITRSKFDYTTAKIGMGNGVTDVSKKFSVDPSIAQKMVDKVQESSAFLKQINIIPVTDAEGEAIALTKGSTIAGRTNTKTGTARKAVDPTGLESNPYKCKKTNFDVALRYEKMDAWAKFDDFYERWQKFVNENTALDMIMIGFNGTSAAETTNRDTSPLLQDVNIGWLHNIRTRAPERHMKEVVVGSGKVKVGETGDYKNLDAVVVDAVNNLIGEVHQDSTNLIVICGRSLLNDKNFAIANDASDNTNVLAGQIIVSQKQIGGYPAVRVPSFPDNAMLITSFDNLSIYFQEDAKRRQIVDNAPMDQVEEFNSSNDAYVIENYEKVAFVENIQIV